jgi:hypothetical protein
VIGTLSPLLMTISFFSSVLVTLIIFGSGLAAAAGLVILAGAGIGVAAGVAGVTGLIAAGAGFAAAATGLTSGAVATGATAGAGAVAEAGTGALTGLANFSFETGRADNVLVAAGRAGRLDLMLEGGLAPQTGTLISGFASSGLAALTSTG